MSGVTHLTWAASLAVLLSAAAPARATPAPVRLLVVTHAAAGASDRADARRDASVRLVDRLPGRVDVVRPVGGQSPTAAIASLRSDPAVAVAEPDRAITLASAPDPLLDYQWALTNTGAFRWEGTTLADADIDADEAWALSTGEAVSVAVADTGADLDHPDLVGHLEPGWDYADSDDDPSDSNGHGTHVTGIIAAGSGNGVGITGIAPGATVVPQRVLDEDGHGYTSAELAAFADAAAGGVKIVNASFGAGTYSAVEDAFIRDHQEVLFVVAAGNQGTNLDDRAKYPCALPYDNVLCVGASTPDDRRASFSDYGAATVDIFAPGRDIASTWIGKGYALESGTSMAAPMAAAVAALVAARFPDFTATQLKQAIVAGADHPQALAGLSVSGGRLNAAGALTAAAELPVPAAAAAPPPVATPAPVPDRAAPVAAEARGGAVVGLAIRGVPRTKRNRAQLSFRLTAPAVVSIRLERRRCARSRCRWQAMARWSVQGAEGLRRLRLGGRTAVPGQWRAVVSTPTGTSRSAVFRVRAG